MQIKIIIIRHGEALGQVMKILSIYPSWCDQILLSKAYYNLY